MLIEPLTRPLAAVVVAVTCIVAALLLPSPAHAVRGAYLSANMNVIGEDVILTVWVGTSPKRHCRGGVRMAGWGASLPDLKTDRTGGGRWRWKVGNNVPAGTWHVRVRCRLPDETVLAKMKFHVPAGPQTGIGVQGLVAPGSMSAEPAHKKGLSQGVLGVTGSEAVAESRPPSLIPSPAGPQTSPPGIEMLAPAAGETVSGEVTVAASSPGPAVRFEAFYSQTPGAPGTAAWHVLGTDAGRSDGFAITWDTTEVPNQGLPSQQTVQVRAIELRPWGETGDADIRRVSVANPSEDGSYRYHVLGACAASDGCEVGLYAGPGTSFSSLGSRAEGDAVDVACQEMGEAPADLVPDDVWNRLSDGAWIADRYVDTPGVGAFSPPIPACE